MAGEITQEYDAVRKAARRSPPAEQLRLAQALMSDSQVVAFWEEWQRQFAEPGDVASEAEIDTIVTHVRTGRQRGKP
jgi:hypothetical protein